MFPFLSLAIGISFHRFFSNILASTSAQVAIVALVVCNTITPKRPWQVFVETTLRLIDYENTGVTHVSAEKKILTCSLKMPAFVFNIKVEHYKLTSFHQQNAINTDGLANLYGTT